MTSKRVSKDDESVRRLAMAVSRVMKEERIEYSPEKAFELAEDLWAHARRSELGFVLPDTKFVDSFDAAVLVAFLEATRDEMSAP